MFAYGLMLLIGLFAGITGGMLGVGGSIVMIPALTELLGPDQHLYQSAAMIVNFFVVLPAAYHHRRVGSLDRSAITRLVPLGIVSVIVGVIISELGVFSGTGEAYLRLLFGLFLLSLMLADLRRMLRGSDVAADTLERTATDPNSEPRNPRDWSLRSSIAVAVPTGLIAGLLGVGGGVLSVPLQRRFLNMSIRTAIGNSSAIIMATSLVGALVKNYAYYSESAGSLAPLQLAAMLIPSAMIGSAIGSRLTHQLPLRAVKMSFFLLLLFVAIRLSYQAVLSIRAS